MGDYTVNSLAFKAKLPSGRGKFGNEQSTGVNGFNGGMLREEGKERRKREILSCDINSPFPITHYRLPITFYSSFCSFNVLTV